MKAFVVCKQPDEKDAARACKIVEEHFEVLHAWKDTLTKENLANIDVVIGIGGDGTILSASHYVTDMPLIGVNANPDTSEGALSTATVDTLSEKLHAVEKNNYSFDNLERIQISINGEPTDMSALNEVYVGHDTAYRTSRYTLSIENSTKKEESQRSSGVLVVTGTGSTAWYKSAGGKPFSPQSKHLMLLVREPYGGRLFNPTLTHEKIEEHHTVRIIPKVPSIVVLDSIREIHVKENDVVEIKIAKHPLKRIK